MTGVGASKVKVILLLVCAEEVFHHALLFEPDPLAIFGDLSYVLLNKRELGLATSADLNGAAGI